MSRLTRIPWICWCIVTIFSADISNSAKPSKICTVEKEKGVCMFVTKCVRVGGIHLGTCMDGFYFGSCCKIPKVNSTTTTTEASEEANPTLDIKVNTEPVNSEATTDVPEISTIYDISSNIINDSGVDVDTNLINSRTSKPLSSENQTESSYAPIEEETTTTKSEETVTEKPLDELSYSEACGRQPWLHSEHKHNLEADIDILADKEIPQKNAMPRQLWKEFLNYLQKQKDHGRYGRSLKMPRRAKIQKGEDAEYGEFPWQVSLRRKQFGVYLHQCGAVLLTRNWAITAAHCVHEYSADKLLLRMGDYYTGSAGPSLREPHGHQDRKVQLVAEHSMFDHRTFDYDIALLRLDSPVKFQPNILPVCLPEVDDDLVGEEAWVTGHGKLYSGGPQPKVLQKVMVPIVGNSECELMYHKSGYREYIPRNFICAGYSEGGKDSCEGDSGGPLVTRSKSGKFVLTGIVSWGRSCGQRNQPGVYTRVSTFTNWINGMLNIN